MGGSSSFPVVEVGSCALADSIGSAGPLIDLDQIVDERMNLKLPESLTAARPGILCSLPVIHALGAGISSDHVIV